MRNISAEIRQQKRPSIPTRIFQATQQDDYVAKDISDFKHDIDQISLSFIKKGLSHFNEVDLYATLVNVEVTDVQRSCLSPSAIYVLKDATGELSVLFDPRRGTLQSYRSFADHIRSRKLDVGDCPFAIRLECKLREGFPYVAGITKWLRPTHFSHESPLEQILPELFPDYIPKF
jgi:hypothetical protein